MKFGICNCKASGEICREQFWALSSFVPEEKGTANCHQKYHGTFHGDFHAWFQEKISKQHFCKPCRDDLCFSGGGGGGRSFSAPCFCGSTLKAPTALSIGLLCCKAAGQPCCAVEQLAICCMHSRPIIEKALASYTGSPLVQSQTQKNSANKGLPLPLGCGVCETKSKNGRSRPRKPFISRVFCAQRRIETMVSEAPLTSQKLPLCGKYQTPRILGQLLKSLLQNPGTSQKLLQKSALRCIRLLSASKKRIKKRVVSPHDL